MLSARPPEDRPVTRSAPASRPKVIALAAAFNVAILLSLVFIAFDVKHRFSGPGDTPRESYWWLAAVVTSMVAGVGMLLQGPGLADYLRHHVILLRVWLWYGAVGILSSAALLVLGAVRFPLLDPDVGSIAFGVALGAFGVAVAWVGVRVIGRALSSAPRIAELLTADPDAFFLFIRRIDDLGLLGVISHLLPRPTQPIRSIAGARIALVLAVVVFFGPTVLWIIITGFEHRVIFSEGADRAVGFLIMLGSVTGAFALERAARSLRAADARDVLSDDKRPPVLYLRSFLVEGVQSSKYEDVLREFFREIGPLVAIGKPSELLQTAGAARIYPGDDWHEVVLRLMREAVLVLVQIGATEGLSWEIATLVQTVDPQRVVLILRPPQPKWRRRHLLAEYQMFRESLGRAFPRPLPSSIGKRGHFRLTWLSEPIGLGRFISFGPDWEPDVLAVRDPPFPLRLRLLFGPRSAPLVLRSCLRSVLERLRLVVPRVPLGLGEMAFMSATIPAAAAAVAGLVMIAVMAVSSLLLVLGL